METNLCGDGWGWNGSSAGMGGDETETGWECAGNDIRSAGMGVQVSTPCFRKKHPLPRKTHRTSFVAVHYKHALFCNKKLRSTIH